MGYEFLTGIVRAITGSNIFAPGREVIIGYLVEAEDGKLYKVQRQYEKHLVAGMKVNFVTHKTGKRWGRISWAYSVAPFK
jgi:hypothetical protein